MLLRPSSGAGLPGWLSFNFGQPPHQRSPRMLCVLLVFPAGLASAARMKAYSISGSQNRETHVFAHVNVGSKGSSRSSSGNSNSNKAKDEEEEQKEERENGEKAQKDQQSLWASKGRQMYDVPSFLSLLLSLLPTYPLLLLLEEVHHNFSHPFSFGLVHVHLSILATSIHVLNTRIISHPFFFVACASSCHDPLPLLSLSFFSLLIFILLLPALLLPMIHVYCVYV